VQTRSLVAINPAEPTVAAADGHPGRRKRSSSSRSPPVVDLRSWSPVRVRAGSPVAAIAKSLCAERVAWRTRTRAEPTVEV
jgi:hypothetical protein